MCQCLLGLIDITFSVLLLTYLKKLRVGLHHSEIENTWINEAKYHENSVQVYSSIIKSTTLRPNRICAMRIPIILDYVQ